MELTIFAQRLKQAREDFPMKQSELAKLVGVTPATISAYENSDGKENGKKPTLENAQNIASVLGVSLDWLCGLNDELSNKEPKAIEIFNSLMMIITHLNATVETPENDCHTDKPTIKIDNQIIGNFLNEYMKLNVILKDEQYPKFARDVLRNSIIDRYKDCIFRDGNIYTSEEEYKKEKSKISVSDLKKASQEFQNKINIFKE